MRSTATPRNALLVSAALGVLLAAGCVDAPSAPTHEVGPGTLAFAPQLTLLGPDGPARTAAQTDALSEAFDRVNRFRMVVRRASNNEVVVDTVLIVTPGADEYDLAVPVVTATANEQFLVELTAFEGEQELFSAPSIPVQAVRVDAAGQPVGQGAGGGVTTNVALTYSGPGATAASVEVEPGHVVLAPGSSAALASKVLDTDGAVVAGVPVSWTSTAEAVATVAAGEVTGGSDGVAEIIVATPTGLEARTTVYVVGGSLAYVEGGVVMTRAPAGGDGTVHGGEGAATGPAWSPDGGRLFYAEAGSIRLAGSGTALFGGVWPSVSPTGMTLAAEAGGTLVFANDDGSNATAGPAGTVPVWTSEGELLVGGGSVQRVRADGSGRTEVAGGSAELPAFGNGGSIAYVDGGSLLVEGGGIVANGVTGRASWSPSGVWLAAPTSSGLVLAPSDGSAPPVALPGLEGASDPAFQPSNPLSAPDAVSLTGLEPDPPVPGQTVTFRGQGFDWVIPRNNQVVWPTHAGQIETIVRDVTATTATTDMPRSVAAGQIRLENRAGAAVLDFVPAFGAIEVHATTLDGTGVPDVQASVLDDGGTEVASGLTGADGQVVLPGLTPGTYTLNLVAPAAFVLRGAASVTFDLGVEAKLVEVELLPLVHSIVVDPEEPTLTVGELIAVTVQAFDVNGNPITSFESTFWGPGTSHLGAGGQGLSGQVAGVHPTAQAGEARFNVRLNQQTFSLQATVTSRIEGTVTRPAPATTEGQSLTTPQPARDVDVRLRADGEELASAGTDGSGRYSFHGLAAGTYTVEVIPPEELNAPSPTRSVTLDQGNPTGTADFALSDVSDGGQASDFRVLILGNGYPDDQVKASFSAQWEDIEFQQHNGSESIPSVAFLTTFDVVLLYEDGVYTDANLVGDAVAAYVAAGGNVVFGTFYWQDRSDAGWHEDGWGALEAVDPFVSKRDEGNGGSEYNADALDPASIVPHVLTDGVNTLTVHSYHGGVIAKEDAVVLANWSDGVPLIGYRIESGGQRLLGVTTAPGYVQYGSYTGDFFRLWENALRWAAAGSTPVPPARQQSALSAGEFQTITPLVTRQVRSSDGSGSRGR